MAIGAMKQLHQQGVRIPEQVSVIGFEISWLAPYMVPALSSVENTGDGDDQWRVLTD